MEQPMINPCNVHPQFESVVKDLKDTTRYLVEGQVELKMTLIQLTEHLKGLERLEKRVDGMELLRREGDKIKDCKIDELRVFMYKVVGAVAVLSFLGPIAVKVAMVMFL